MPGKVTVSSQQPLTDAQCIESWLLLSPKPSEVPADSRGNCTQHRAARDELRAALELGPLGSADPRGAHVKALATWCSSNLGDPSEGLSLPLPLGQGQPASP